MRNLISSVAIAAVFAAPLQAAEFNFCWVGAAGYSMTGVIAFPDEKLNQDIITEDDVTRFEIIGYNRMIPIGTWSMEEAGWNTTWHLRFDPQTLSFPTGGPFGTDASQGWNANGNMTDCGRNGFGFNSGNYSQDFCLFGAWVEQSAIDPNTPFRATTQPVDAACDGVFLMGRADDFGTITVRPRDFS